MCSLGPRLIYCVFLSEVNTNLMNKQRQAFLKFIQRYQALGPCLWDEARRRILPCSRKIWPRDLQQRMRNYFLSFIIYSITIILKMLKISRVGNELSEFKKLHLIKIFMNHQFLKWKTIKHILGRMNFAQQVALAIWREILDTMFYQMLQMREKKSFPQMFYVFLLAKKFCNEKS